MSTQSIRQVLVQSGVQATADCLSIHTGRRPDSFARPGYAYREATLWSASVDVPADEVPTFVQNALDAREAGDSSHVRCFAVDFHPPFSGLRLARTWVDPLVVPAGWSIEVSVNASWRQHLQAFVPIDRFLDGADLAAMPNLMAGFDTRLSPSAMDIDAFAPGSDAVHTTNWVSVRASVSPDAAEGYPFGETAGLADPITWNFSWSEC